MNERRARDALILGRPRPRPIGLYPETKHPSYFRDFGLPLEARLIDSLERHGYSGPDAPVFIQSFEVANLKALSRMTALPLVQLIEAEGKPYDFVLCGDPRRYADLLVPAGLAEIAAYARAIGPSKHVLIPPAQDGSLGQPTTLVADATPRGSWSMPGPFGPRTPSSPPPRAPAPIRRRSEISTASFRPSSISASMVSSPITRGSPCARCDGRRREMRASPQCGAAKTSGHPA
jgi:hypothetical protein